MSLLNWIDAKFFGIRRLFASGAELPERPAINIGSGLAAVDNPTDNRTDLSVNIGDATTSASGLMSASDKTKLGAAYDARIQEISVTISYAELTGLGVGVQEWAKAAEKQVAAGARLLALSVESVTAFNDGAEGYVVVRFGPESDDDQIFLGVNVSTSSGFPDAPFTMGNFPGRLLTPGIYKLTIADESAVDLNQMVAGSVTVKLFWWVSGG